MVDARSDPPYGPESGLLFHSNEDVFVFDPNQNIGFPRVVVECYRRWLFSRNARSTEPENGFLMLLHPYARRPKDSSTQDT